MRIKEYLKEVKNDYEKTDATWHLKMSGWNEIEKQIDPVVFSRKTFWFKKLAIAGIAALVLLAGYGSFVAVSAAMPGSTLYPVKVLSERVIEKVTGSNQVTIDHRADEIINMSQDQKTKSDDLKKVIDDYKKNVDSAKKEIEESGHPNPEFEQKLEEQHKEFENISKDDVKIDTEIKSARESSDVKIEIHND